MLSCVIRVTATQERVGTPDHMTPLADITSPESIESIEEYWDYVLNTSLIACLSESRSSLYGNKLSMMAVRSGSVRVWRSNRPMPINGIKP